ncbi:DUF928 domain-containing protein [Trichothermofontia sp.]
MEPSTWLRSAFPLTLSCILGLSLPMASGQAHPVLENPIVSGANVPSLISTAFSTALRTALKHSGSPRSTSSGTIRHIVEPSAPPCSVNPGKDGVAALPPEGLLMLLIPPAVPGEARPVEVTLAERPTLLLHVPDPGGYIVDVSLTLDIEEIYQGTLTLPARAGIVQLKLPDSLPALAIGKPYDLALTLFCDPQDVKQVRTLSYAITRVAVPPTVYSQATGDPLQFASDLAEAGIWFDAVSSLAALRQTQPASPIIQTKWRELLQSAALDGLADQPLLDCCQLPEPSPR